jgi:PAS domain S-box-containing protein
VDFKDENSPVLVDILNQNILHSFKTTVAEHTQISIRRLRILSVAALASIGILTVIGSLVAQYLIREQEGSAHIINLSGRQRMLSQRITKSVLAIERDRYYYKERANSTILVDELETSFVEWKKVHNGLQYGSAVHNLPVPHNSKEIHSLFTKITPYYQEIDSAVTQLLILLHRSDDTRIIDAEGKTIEHQKQRFQQFTTELLLNQKQFLDGMDAITFQYDKESTAHILDIQRTLQIVVVITLLAIFMEALFVFRPAIGKLGVVVEQLGQSQELSRSLSEYVIEGSSVGVFVLDADFKVVMVNRALEKYFGFNRQDLIGKDKRALIRENISKIFDTPDAFMKRVFATYDDNTYIENFDCHILPSATREERWLEHWSQPITSGIFKGGRVEHYTDITSRILSATALAQGQSRLQALVNSINEIIFEFSAQGEYLDIWTHNPKLLFKPKEDMIGKTITEILGKEFGDVFQKLIDTTIEKKETQSLEYSLDLEGGTYWFLARVSPIVSSPAEIPRVCMLVLDITERKKMEETIAASLRDKEVLLKEIHHRVKNNLQVISSLLSLQSRSVLDQHTLNVLSENAGRVRAMALIHEELYNAENLVNINFSMYIRNLTTHLSRAYGIDSGRIKIHIDADENTLAIDDMATCGLIVNELVSNCFKHGFPNNRSGRISIALKKVGERMYVLTVQDDGVGFSGNLDLDSVQSLGLKLVKYLARKLDGELQISNHTGMTTTITFSQLTDEDEEE